MRRSERVAGVPGYTKGDGCTTARSQVGKKGPSHTARQDSLGVRSQVLEETPFMPPLLPLIPASPLYPYPCDNVRETGKEASSLLLQVSGCRTEAAIALQKWKRCGDNGETNWTPLVWCFYTHCSKTMLFVTLPLRHCLTFHLLPKCGGEARRVSPRITQLHQSPRMR